MDTVDFVSLPDQFKLPILKELNWKDLNNLKLVCRDLYLTVVRNIEKLDRPKVGYLKIFYDENNILGVDYSSKCLINNRDGVVPHQIDFNDDREYDIFLKDKDFTELKRLVFENVTSDKIIDVMDFKFGNENVKHLSPCYFVSLSDGTSLIFQIMISKSYELRIPYNSNLLRKEYLRKFGLFEKDGSRSFTKKVIMDIFTLNPMLEYGNISADANRPIFFQITKHLSDLGFFDFKNRCDTERFSLDISWGDESAVLEEDFYREVYDKIESSIKSVKDFDLTFYPQDVSLNCSKCGKRHTNLICYFKIPKTLEIWIG